MKDLRLSRAIRDLTEAISGPHLIPSNCARAVETLRVLMAPKDMDRKLGWPLMQEHLRVTQRYLKSVTDFGVAPRHGDHEFVAAKNTRNCANRAWTLVDRYIEYRKRGSAPLPIDHFPLLDVEL